MAEDTIYQPINSHTGEIRLLVLSGSLCEDGSPEYVFKYAKLCDEPIFEALSYVWGDPTPVKLVLVDGVSTKVPRNLGIILPYLTSRLFSCPIWIDALCINQEDHREKGEQIALMGRIFSQAQHVLSWLGERPGPEEDDGWHRFEQRVLWQKYPPLLHTTHSKMSKERVATTSLLL
ncbi:heterokaryon incompatibility protein-domain-containing protein, partial [Cladorrhinum sp. PSN332]